MGKRSFLQGFLFIFITIYGVIGWTNYPKASYEPQIAATGSFLPINGIYKVRSEADLVADKLIYGDSTEANPGLYETRFYKDEPVGIEFLSDGMVLVRFRLLEGEDSPDAVILTREEFYKLALEFIADGDIKDLMAMAPGPYEIAGKFSRDRSGRIRGGGKNCVSVVKHLAGFSGRCGNGRACAATLASTGRWKRVSINTRYRGVVCSWRGGGHGLGHVAWFDGKCFQPTYKGNCGNPGKKYRLSMCVAPAGGKSHKGTSKKTSKTSKKKKDKKKKSKTKKNNKKKKTKKSKAKPQNRGR